jgi:acyl-coenzyme A thioesterase PaaI-like protein
LKIDLNKALEKARESKWALKKLNLGLGLGIPFNKPHGIKVLSVEKDAVVTTIPFKRKNQNHIGGIHACGLATAAEFCSGLMLLRKVDQRKYRLIMQKLEVEYFYQAKHTASARFELDEATFGEKILAPLENEGQTFFTCEIPVHDTEQNHLCTVHTRWQIKEWSKVKTKR